MSVHMSNYLENKCLDLILRNTAYSPAATVYMGLFTAFTTGDDGDTFTEVSGGSYARTACTWDAASARATANSADIVFPAASGSWGTITYAGVFDASSGGNLLFWFPLSSSISVNSGETLTVAAGAATIAIGGSLATYAANAFLNRVLRNASWTAISTVYAALLTAFTDDTTYTEVSGSNYGRTSASFAAASAGATSNSSAITSPTASGSWGTVTHVAIFDASTSGNLLWRGALDNTRSITTGKNLKFNTSALAVTVN